MANIRFNKNAFSGIFTNTSSWLPAAGYAPAWGLSGGSDGSYLLTIYKGVIESFPSFTARSSRSADVLITFSLPSAGSAYIYLPNDSSTHVRALIGRCLTSTAASASGLASWFLVSRSLLHSGTDSLTTQTGIVGTVGLPGTGADLEVAQTTITAGNYYRCNGFYINLPLSYTF